MIIMRAQIPRDVASDGDAVGGDVVDGLDVEGFLDFGVGRDEEVEED